MASACTVKGPANEYFGDLEAAGDAYLCRLFPEWKEADRTYMFPPVFPFRYIAPTGKASGAVPLSKSEEVDVKGDEAELRIFRALDKFGRQESQPMTVLTKFEFKEFIREVLLRKLPVESVDDLFASMTLTDSDLSREIDFLVVHRRAGVVLIEVKATEKFKTNRYLDAKKQLEVAEKFIQALFKAMRITLPVYKVIAMPNVTDVGRDAAGYIDLRKEHLVRGEDECDDIRLFASWWKKHFLEIPPSEGADTMTTFSRFISILVGQRTAISATANILAGVSKTIDEQSFLERSFSKLAKKQKTGIHGSKMVDKPTEKVRPGVLAKQFMFLNYEQLKVWSGPLLQVIMGSPGTGKTILLQYKALECLQKNEKVLVVVPSPLDQLYTKFFIRNGVPDGLTTVITFSQLADFLSKDAEWEATGPLHVFVDEFPVLFGEENHLHLLDSFRDFLVKHQDGHSYQWIVEDSEQLALKDQFESFERKQHKFATLNVIDVSTFVSLLCKDKNFVFSPRLQTMMRYTTEIYRHLVQHYYQLSPIIRLTIDMSDHDDFDFSNTASGLNIGHHISGPQVIEERRTYESFKEGLDHSLQVIKSELGEWLKEKEGQCDYSQFAVLVETPECVDQLSPLMREEGIPICCISDLENAVVLDCQDRALSYEWPIVIAICQSKNNFILISRAMVRLRILWWRQDST
ncbi:uncharacterized protein [Montipora foliosa]|uniref:uncharacterized protein n=1 Tax=Montipora foliosa TaxID=591990 RepID=UPI0035F11638